MTRPTSKPFAEVARLALAGGTALSRSLVESLITRHDKHARSRLALLWSYYRNQMDAGPALTSHGRHYRLAQEKGLPSRVVGAWDKRGLAARFAGDDRSWSRKEVVIENDIAWRIQTMVDFMFGRPITIASTAADPALRRTIERVLAQVWESSGGIGLLQDMALLGHVYGHIDLLVRSKSLSREREVSPADSTPTSPSGEGDLTQETTPRGEGSLSATGDPAPILDRAAQLVRVELIEPPRGVALLSESDYRTIDAYIIRTRRESRDASAPPPIQSRFSNTLTRWWRSTPDDQPAGATSRQLITTTEVFAGGFRQLYEQTADTPPRLIDESPALVTAHPDDPPPIVHIQNISQPFEYEGLGEVEPLIPLQDELNTRLSDRASRVTMQSFKMFLAKGLDGAAALPIAPGIIWATDNPDAQVTAFGGDAASPSEDRHIDEIREAMDKVSCVPPIASGVVRAKIGNLTSENALRITLLGLTSKTNRKRITYGRGIIDASKLILEALDRLGILHTSPADRELRIDWTDPIPRDEQLALLAAQKKVELGVPRDQVLSELGYAPDDESSN